MNPHYKFRQLRSYILAGTLIPRELLPEYVKKISQDPKGYFMLFQYEEVLESEVFEDLL